ncbi:hypothetical protein ACQR13_26975, partial [Bradyrhizobium sp. HKCCYLRH3059]|uniref:hypothetical protein n=1 Tax=unclassified Bradyrhizobium TaxID=2631580 RepID=UPI003EBD5FF0
MKTIDFRPVLTSLPLVNCRPSRPNDRRPHSADSVEKVGSSFVVNAICFEDELARCGSRGRQRGHRDQLGHLTKVLSGCSEGELV